MTDREIIVAAIERLYPVPPNEPYDERAGLMHANNIEFIHTRLRYDDDGKCDIQIYCPYKGNEQGCVTFNFDDAGALIKFVAER